MNKNKYKIVIHVTPNDNWKDELDTPERAAEAITLNIEFLGEIDIVETATL